eukprot:CAMPEP_0196598034 /NCGR_PEP_ID=MMETSP1081-20130531/94081_1 /TAXON_ID=36882 /ORGANISM="Pyramimonas amylifera, Strain CCMP720" /LENGTH=57 /DNA_ID=CAMNT_0041923657 /DNA_START=338 /DNA_END=511 /DNA_ORIENTATION=+
MQISKVKWVVVESGGSMRVKVIKGHETDVIAAVEGLNDSNGMPVGAKYYPTQAMDRV